MRRGEERERRGRRTLEMALARVGFGPVFLAPKRRFMMVEMSLRRSRQMFEKYVEARGEAHERSRSILPGLRRLTPSRSKAVRW